MLEGVYLTLLIGPGVPVPAPRVVAEALTSVQVNVEKERTGFQLTLTVGKDSPLVTAMLPAGYFDPIVTRVIVIVTVNGTPNVLSDGMITRQELSPSNEPGKTTLTLTGEDLSVLMNLVENPFRRFPGMDDMAQVNLILATYLVLGIIPTVMPTIFPNFSSPTERIPTQVGTDLEHIRRLSSHHGYVFYVEPSAIPGMNIAYWGPDVRVPIPQPALNVNFDAHSNVESLSISLDGTAKKIVVITIYDPVTGKITIPIPIPNISILRPPMGARLTAPARVEFPDCISKLNASEAASKALDIVFRASDAISVSGSLDVLRYGRVLKARQMVGVRGAGLTYDGFYYVNSVTHTIKSGEYKQNFTLSRDGLISNTPVVVP
jgi:hypothetical protein